MATFLEVAEGLSRQAAAMRLAPLQAATVTAPLLAASIHGIFGHAPPLVDLAESTQDERAKLGYAPNDPLVRTHAIEDSWVSAVVESPEGPIAGVGSSNQIAAWHEWGGAAPEGPPANYPARPAGALGFAAAQPLAKKIWHNMIGRVSKIR